jgi:hypothetical protein
VGSGEGPGPGPAPYRGRGNSLPSIVALGAAGRARALRCGRSAGRLPRGDEGDEDVIDDLAQLLSYFQGTGEFRAGFDPHVMAMAIRAAINAVPAQLARDPVLDIGHHARELADMFHIATRPG